MAKACIRVIEALRKTAQAIDKTNFYQWGHMGLCNCGFLAQQITRLRKDEIHSRAMQRYGDWSEQLNDYCSTSGLPMDDLIKEILAIGFDADDLKHLERLSDENVLKQLGDHHTLKHNVKGDVVKYLNKWADMLEEQLLENIELTQLNRSMMAHRILAS